MHYFKGWIPTVTGRLSFSILGEAEHPSQAISANVCDHKIRYLITYQKRILLDSILPAKATLARALFDLEGRFWFVCLATSSNDPEVQEDVLTGRLYIFAGREAWRGPAEQLVKSKQAFLKQYTTQIDCASLYSHFNSDFETFQNDLSRYASFWATFNLSRSGVSSVAVPDNIQDSVSPDAPTFPTNPELREELFGSVCAQLFFFLKDIAHHHQHHSPFTDTLVDLYSVESMDEKDDFRWRCETLRMLYRSVLRFKRINDEGVVNLSRGILAYAKSFIEISKREGHHLKPEWIMDTLEDSLLASQERLRLSIQDRIRKITTLRATILSIVGALIAFAALAGLIEGNIVTREEAPAVAAFAKFLVTQPEMVFAVCVILLILSGWLLRIWHTSKFEILRNTTRLVQPMPRKVTVSLLMAGGAFFAWIVIQRIV